MNKYNFLNNCNFYIFKPTKFFYFFSFISLLIWLYLGPISWRHIDDFGPMYEFLKKYVYESNNVFPSDLSNINVIKTFLSSLKDNYGWGSYPHLWSIIYLPLSLSFIKYGIDVTRYIVIFIGFSTCIVIAFFLSNIITLLLTTRNNLTNRSFSKIRILSDFFSALFIFYCPQIMLHSITYMPYQIAALSTLIIFNVFVSFQKKELLNFENNYVTLSFEYIILLIWFAILLSWQSIFIGIALILYLVTYITISKDFLFFRILVNSIKIKISNLLKQRNWNFQYIFYPLSLLTLIYFSRIYLIKLINLNRLGHLNGIPFAWGTGNEYNLNLFNLNVTHIQTSELIQHLLFVMARISSLSLYPFRIYKNISAIIIFSLFIFTYYLLYKNSKVSSRLSVLIAFTFLVPIILSIFGKFILAPSRHAIYLFPCIWIPVGSFLVDQFSFNKFFQSKNISKIFQTTLIVLFISGLISSHQAINYTKFQDSSIETLAKKADFFPLGKFMGQYDLVSLFFTHGTNEWEIFKNKECINDKDSLEGKLVFLFSHREPFENNLKSKKNLSNAEYFPTKYACIKENTNLELTDYLELNRTTDIEVDNLIENGGSNIFAYLFKISS